MSARPIFKSTLLLTLFLFSVQVLLPAARSATGMAITDSAYCGTQLQTLAADVIVIEAPATLTELTIDKTPGPHPDNHCPLCYLHTPSVIISDTVATHTADNTDRAHHHFISTPNPAPQQQRLQLLAPSHAPPALS